LSEQGEARVVERIQVVGVLGERLAKEGEGLVVSPVLVREDGLGHEDVGLALLRARRRDPQREQAGGHQRDEER
jgi:hypothetical protein